MYQRHTLYPRIILIAALVMACGSGPEEVPMRIDFSTHSISFPGTIYPERYNTRADRNNGHHLIVWSGGGNARKALIGTDFNDKDILTFLESLGAVAGNNLTEKTWTERDNPASAEPDKHVEGTPIDVFVSWGKEEYPIYTLLKETTPEEIDIRVGGHIDLIPLWNSGCVTCSFSCPGGRTSNAAFTIRDQARNTHSFFADLSRLPKDGTEVKIRMEVHP